MGGGDAIRMKMEIGGDEDMDVDEVGDGMEMGKEMKRGIRMEIGRDSDGDRVMDVDEDRDRGGDDYGDEDAKSWRELGCWIGEIMLRFGKTLPTRQVSFSLSFQYT